MDVSLLITLVCLGLGGGFLSGLLEFRLLGPSGQVLAEKVYTMKRYILWRPFIVDLRDTRLPYGQPREFRFSVIERGSGTLAVVDVVVRYHLLNEARRKKIGYNNVDPIAYPVYHKKILLDVRN
jgi:hypothetical protein